MFENRQAFDPAVDSKVPLKRSPLALALRLAVLVGETLFSRHPADLFAWVGSMRTRREPLRYGRPWFTFDATRYISSRLPSAAAIFEYGAGNSTIYWASNAKLVCSVESDPEWARLVTDRLDRLGRRNVNLVSAAGEQSYVDAIHAFPQDHFDLIVVDGDFRRACTLAAIEHLKPGGMLVVDNTDWHWFRADSLQGIPPAWTRVVCSGYAPMMGHKSETTIFVRPYD